MQGVRLRPSEIGAWTVLVCSICCTAGALGSKGPLTFGGSGGTSAFQGRCRQFGVFGGHCLCFKQSVTECFEFAQAWLPLASVEYESANHFCYLYHLSAKAPLDCPQDCAAEIGLETVQFYAGDLSSGFMCMASIANTKRTIQSGRCRELDGDASGGQLYKDGGGMFASDCFARAEERLTTAAGQYRSSTGSCGIKVLWQEKPSEVLQGWVAAEGTADVSFYVGNGEADYVCMSSWGSSQRVVQQGLCRQDGIYGGFCLSESVLTVARCFLDAQMWSPAVAAQFWNVDACALLIASKDAPAQCPNGYAPRTGNGDVEIYAGNGDAKSFCMTSWV